MAVSGGVVEHFGTPLIVSMAVSEAVVAGDVVNVEGDYTVSQGDADEVHGKGVAMQTATAVGDVIDVAFPGKFVMDLRASGAIDAGHFVKSAAAGDVAAADADVDPRLLMGFSLAAAADNIVPVVIL